MVNIVNIVDHPATKAERLEIYCKGLCDGLTRRAAYVAAGYADTPGANANAQKFHKINHEYITQYFADHIGQHAPAALRVLLEIMNNEDEKGGIRLKAAQDLLDRAGFSAKTKIEVSTKEINEMNTAELTDEIKRILSEEPKLATIFTGQTSS